jgi:NAD+ synthase (glutamine-hydrolysing)
MKVALAQLDYIPGDIAHNSAKIISAISNARLLSADLIVFSELAVTGYPPLDLLQRSDLTGAAMTAVKEIASHCTGIAAVVGGPSPNTGLFGKSLFNSAFFMNDGMVMAVINKTLLPTYDVFDENRYFEPGSTFQTVEFKGERLAITICEDLWDEQPFGDRGVCRLYGVTPLDELMKEKPSLIINIAANPFSHNRIKIREEIFIKNAIEYGMPLISVNQTGGYTDLIFDGSSMVIDADGTLLEKLAFCSEEIKVIDIPAAGADRNNYSLPAPFPADMTGYIHKALSTGITDFFVKSGQKKAIVGLSGGIDSAVVLALAAEALGADNTLAVLMPSAYSSEHSVKDALKMAEQLKVPHNIVSIEEVRQALEKTMKPFFGDRAPDVTEENIQARLRAVILMAFSNKFGYMVLNTSNKSEAATGYGTLYGDMIGGLSVLGDVYKSEVYKLAREINSEREIIPERIISKPPSAELRPDQLDTDSLPPYDRLDPVLFRYIELERSPQQIIDEGFDAGLVEKVAKLVRSSEFKRRQSPPVLRVSSRAFGSGRRIPIISKYH